MRYLLIYIDDREVVSDLNMHIVSINNILLTVLGVVVGLALSFRSSTAYDR